MMMIILIVDNDLTESFICIGKGIYVGSIRVFQNMANQTFLVSFLSFVLLVEFLVVIKQDLLV